jgi:Putative MetA-pathway of phenol degradation
MSGKRFMKYGASSRLRLAGIALWTAAVLATPAMAQQDAAGTAVPSRHSFSSESAPGPIVDSGVTQAGCSSCSSGFLHDQFSSGSPSCNSGCYPGREGCDNNCDADCFVGRLFGGLSNCICCPDPCYEPRWQALADAAFFTEAARPVTQMRLRWDSAFRLPNPDKAEFFWARADGNGKGPKPPAGIFAERRVDYDDFTYYMEGAIDRFSAFVEMPYRQISGETTHGASGMADMNIGTKTLLLDCELMQFSFQFKTYLPTGNFTKGLGTGHVSLEPSLLLTLKLTSDTYFQGQTAYWFPLGGDAAYQGPVFHYHMSVNHLLCNCGHNIQLIGTAELIGYEIGGGSFTDPVTGRALSAKDIGDIISVGPGIRMVICDKVDFGVGTSFAVTPDRMAEDLVRAEFRWRF